MFFGAHAAFEAARAGIEQQIDHLALPLGQRLVGVAGPESSLFERQVDDRCRLDAGDVKLFDEPDDPRRDIGSCQQRCRVSSSSLL